MTGEQSHGRLWAEPPATRGSSPRWFRFLTFDIALQPRWRSCVFFLAVGAVAAFLGGEVLRAAFVAMLGESVEVSTLERAVALDPANPEWHHRLGMVLCQSLEEPDRTEGLKHLRRATELNPYEARYWSDLAWVCEMNGDAACATQGVDEAVKLAPMRPQLHWVAANTFLRAGKTDAALEEFRRLLKLDPTYAPATFHLCLGALHDPQLILQRVLPPGTDPRLRLAYLNFLSTNELANQAHQVWLETVSAGASFPLASASPYLEHLLETGRFEEAQGVWQDLEKLGIIPQPNRDQDDNLVFNGDFERPPLGVGFDWRDRAGPFISLDLSDSSAHTGKRCLRIDFTVSRNEAYAPLYEFIPVPLNQAFLLTAFVRSQDITSDSGPRLQVVDPVHPQALNVTSESTVGSTPWHPISLKFCTGPDTRLVQLSVIRQRGRIFPTEITGSFWLDSVVLKSLGPASSSACPPPGP